MDSTVLDTVRSYLFIEAKEFSPNYLGINTEPELTEYIASINQRIEIADIEADLYKSSLGNRYNLALALLTAHNLTMSKLQESGQTGLIVEEKVGEETIKYAQSKNESSYSSSTYGSRFWQLVKTYEPEKRKAIFGGFAI